MIFSTNKQGDDCCMTQPNSEVKCPTCNKKSKGVLAKTLKALLTDKSKSKLSCFSGFYYCTTPSCKTIYFREETTLTQKDMITVVGLKDGAISATVCYCFGWTKEKIKAALEDTGKTIALEDIKAKMNNDGCVCEVLNPSGRCCLSDVSNAIKEITKQNIQ